MPSSPIGRRGFIAASAAGGAALVTLGGLEYHANAKLDVEAMASQMEVPPAVAAYYRRQSQTGYVAGPVPQATGGGTTREYWIKAVKAHDWDICPTHRDAMMDRPINGKTKITALVYQRLQEADGKAVDPRPADRLQRRRQRRHPLPQRVRDAGDDASARDLLHGRHGRDL